MGAWHTCAHTHTHSMYMPIRTKMQPSICLSASPWSSCQVPPKRKHSPFFTTKHSSADTPTSSCYALSQLLSPLILTHRECFLEQSSSACTFPFSILFPRGNSHEQCEQLSTLCWGRVPRKQNRTQSAHSRATLSTRKPGHYLHWPLWFYLGSECLREALSWIFKHGLTSRPGPWLACWSCHVISGLRLGLGAGRG